MAEGKGLNLLDIENKIVLLDTCTFYWSAYELKSIPKKVDQIIDNCKQVLISATSFWEIANKEKRGKLKVNFPLEVVRQKIEDEERFLILPTEVDHFLTAARLNWEHKDPFDRLIVSIAKLENAYILSPDEAIKSYYPKTIW